MKQKKRAKELLKNYQRQQPTISARIGNHDNVIDVPNRQGYVFARLQNGNVVEIYNDVVPNVLDSNILIGNNPGEPHLLQVLGSSGGKGRYGDSSEKKHNTINHALSHQWFAYDGGNDVAFSELRQFLPFRPTPNGMSVHIYRGVSWLDGQWQYTSGSSIDFTPYVPPTGTSEYALIYINTGSFPNFVIGSGSSTTVENLTLNDIPDPYPGTLSVAAVRLYGGMTGISETRQQTDIIDLRFPMWHDHPFTELDDVPHSYTGSFGKTLFVKQDESGLDFRPSNRRNTIIVTGSSYTLNDIGTVFVNAGEGDVTIIMPPFPHDGDDYFVKRIDVSGTSVVVSGTIDDDPNEFLYASESLHLIWSSGSTSWYAI